jgi:hypothetical protein
MWILLGVRLVEQTNDALHAELGLTPEQTSLVDQGR